MKIYYKINIIIFILINKKFNFKNINKIIFFIECKKYFKYLMINL